MDPVFRGGVSAWKVERTVEKFERARERQVFRSQPVAREFEEEDGKIAPVRAPMREQGASAVSKERYSPSLTVESRDMEH